MSQAATVSPIRAAISELEGEFHLLDPAALDAAILGLVAGFGDEYGVVCYDRDTAIDLLVADGMARDEAEGFFKNVISAVPSDDPPRMLTSAKALMRTHNAATVRAAINQIEGSFMLLEPADMDAAIVGLAAAPGGSSVTCYDRDLVVDILMKDGMDRDEAEEFFSFNIEGAYMGEETPVYLTSAKSLMDQVDLLD